MNKPTPRVSTATGYPTVLIVDDNRDLLHFLERLMADTGWKILTAESATQATRLMREKPDAAVLDYMLPDGNGVELAVELLQSAPRTQVIIMTGTILPAEEEALCEEHNLPVLRKPFLASNVMNQIRSRLGMQQASAGDVEAAQGRALKVFVSYSHRDEAWQKRLDKHLSTLKHMGIIHRLA